MIMIISYIFSMLVYLYVLIHIWSFESLWLNSVSDSYTDDDVKSVKGFVIISC